MGKPDLININGYTSRLSRQAFKESKMIDSNSKAIVIIGIFALILGVGLVTLDYGYNNNNIAFASTTTTTTTNNYKLNLI